MRLSMRITRPGPTAPASARRRVLDALRHRIDRARLRPEPSPKTDRGTLPLPTEADDHVDER